MFRVCHRRSNRPPSPESYGPAAGCRWSAVQSIIGFHLESDNLRTSESSNTRLFQDRAESLPGLSLRVLLCVKVFYVAKGWYAEIKCDRNIIQTFTSFYLFLAMP
jgi:hypothetical protein